MHGKQTPAVIGQGSVPVCVCKHTEQAAYTDANKGQFLVWRDAPFIRGIVSCLGVHLAMGLAAPPRFSCPRLCTEVGDTVPRERREGPDPGTHRYRLTTQRSQHGVGISANPGRHRVGAPGSPQAGSRPTAAVAQEAPRAKGSSPLHSAPRARKTAPAGFPQLPQAPGSLTPSRSQREVEEEEGTQGTMPTAGDARPSPQLQQWGLDRGRCALQPQ
ncbi:arylsulfatase H [Platysternon megacephalum]|uniref:Arylsulfatase H n=1 Tax=Platysternon megacephalum TaxID=55544 RepID=A0A4D9EM22_9SAUR|nr:arylsulfatase H [Platysternon megacephalum]